MLHVGPNKHGVLVPLPSDTAQHGAPARILCSPSTKSTPRAFSTKPSALVSLIQIVLADASCNIALNALMVLSLAQPFRSSSGVLYIQVKWPQNTITISTLSSPLLQFPAKKKRSNHDQHQEDRSAGQEVAEEGSSWEEAPHLEDGSKGSRQVLHFRGK